MSSEPITPAVGWRTPRSRSPASRLEPLQRMPGVDLARGVALVGMFAAHLVATPALRWSDPQTWTGLAVGRSSILFATLAGVSLSLAFAEPRRLPEGPDVPRASTTVRLLSRAATIWVVGAILVLVEVPVIVILPAYAMLFAYAVVLIRFRTRTLFMLAVAFALVAPFIVTAIDRYVAVLQPGHPSELFNLLGWNYPFVLWVAFAAAGIGAGRLLRECGQGAVVLLLLGTGSAVIGYVGFGTIGDRALAQSTGQAETPGMGMWLLTVFQDTPHASGVGEAFGSGGFALAMLAVSVLVCSTPTLRWLMWPVRAVGAMPLTAYVAHLVIWAGWMHTQSGTVTGQDFRALQPFWPMTIGVTIGCMLWTVTVGRGPIEAFVARAASALAGCISKIAQRRHPDPPTLREPGTIEGDSEGRAA